MAVKLCLLDDLGSGTRSVATCGRLSEAPTPPLLAVGGLPENPTLSTKKKNSAGGFKNDSRGGFSGWTRASFAGTGVGAELTSFARNRFELWRKMPPFRNKIGIGRSNGWLFC